MQKSASVNSLESDSITSFVLTIKVKNKIFRWNIFIVVYHLLQVYKLQ